MESELATKFIPNKKDFKELVRRLDVAIEKVTHKPVYIVRKHEGSGSYDVVNYITEDVMVQGLPTREAARNSCRRFNKNPKHRYRRDVWRKIESICDDIYTRKYNIEMHRHNLKAGLCQDYDITLTKLTEEKTKLEHLKDQLKLLV